MWQQRSLTSFFLPSDGVVDRPAVPCGVASPSAIVLGPSGDRADPVVEDVNPQPFGGHDVLGETPRVCFYSRADTVV